MMKIDRGRCKVRVIRGQSLSELSSVGGGQSLSEQLKGARPTPYSRNADGLAVLRSSIREFLCSEAMHHLGIPSTRVLSLIGTDEDVMRDMFYDGRAAYEPGAVVCRTAPSFIRFGSFEIFSSRGEVKTLEALVAYTIQFHFPYIYPHYLNDKKRAY
jgi:uncharacterized protein YdiU (UPF0061 family)